jgi:hypothetical protein
VHGRNRRKVTARRSCADEALDVLCADITQFGDAVTVLEEALESVEDALDSCRALVGEVATRDESSEDGGPPHRTAVGAAF